MKTPESLAALIDDGVIQEVLRPLMSGKEAQIYVVVAGGQECVAKVYKEASQRTFKHRAEYTEGRRSRNTRDKRAVQKRTRHGRKQDEAAWRNTEVDVIFRLREAGVRVPEPINFVDGVLVMELVQDANGQPAPRLGDLAFEPAEAQGIYQQLMREVVRMLCADVVHADFSEFNVLMGADGPVVIDFPQAVDPAHNRNARALLLRDVENLHRFARRFAPNQPTLPLAEEMWTLYETARLYPDTELRGDYRAPEALADTAETLDLINEASEEHRLRHGPLEEDPETESSLGVFRTVVDFTQDERHRQAAKKAASSGRNPRPKAARSGPAKKAKRSGPAKKATAKRASAQEAADAPKKRRGRRRRKRTGKPDTPSESRRESSTRAAETSKQPAGSPRSETPTRPASLRGKNVASGEGANSKRRRRSRRPKTGAQSQDTDASPSGETKRGPRPKQGPESSPAKREGGSPPRERPRRRRPRNRSGPVGGPTGD